jgi:predicted ATP-dependent serine protease
MTTISKTLLKPTDYKVSRFVERQTIKNLDKFQETLAEVAPDFQDAVIGGFQIIGKTNGFQQYVATKEEKNFLINISRLKGATASAAVVEKDLSKMNLTTKRLRDVHFDESLFIPMKSNTALDYCFSNEGGIMPGTNYILIGDPGIGKSSVSIEYAARIATENLDKKVLFISGEMTELDMIPYTKRFPLWLDIETLFVSDLTEGLYKESIEAKLQEGFDLVLGDSFAEIADAIRGDYNETVSGKDKKSYNDIEKWLVDLMVKNNKAENVDQRNTSFIMIQQMTKGGDFVGSNKLKHNTTGMLELRYLKSGERKIVVSKNRRGFKYDNLRFDFAPDTENPIFYDTDRIERDKKVEEEIKKAASEQLNQESATDAWFEQLGGNLEETQEV